MSVPTVTPEELAELEAEDRLVEEIRNAHEAQAAQVRVSSVASPPSEPNEARVDPPEVVRETAGVDRLLRLLAQYSEKLHRETGEFTALPPRTNQAGGIINPNRPDPTLAEPYRKRFRPLRPAVAKLAQYASGLIENARIPQLDKIELQLRLAELEAALDIATQTIR